MRLSRREGDENKKLEKIMLDKKSRGESPS